jgi:hypothetical protein
MDWRRYQWTGGPIDAEGVKVEQFHADPWESLHYALKGRPVPEDDYWRLIVDGELWMSDTPAEIRDMRMFCFALQWTSATHVLINGLGMGLAMKMALSFDTVEHVDVVEIDERIIRLIGKGVYDDPRVECHEHDALTMKFPRGMMWSVVWHDIWPTISEDNLRQMHRLHRMYGHRCAWQGSWCRGEAEWMRRLPG